MRLFSIFLLALLLVGCGNDNGLKKVKLDKDICDRCKMVISSKEHAAQVLNLQTKKIYLFDDLGCAVIWLEAQDWKGESVVYIADAKTSEWLNVNEAFFVYGNPTPMDFKYEAFKSEQKGKENLGYEIVKEAILRKAK